MALRRSRTIAVWLLLAALAAILTGCGGGQSRRVTVVALFDTSGSSLGVRDTFIRDYCGKAVPKLAGGCGEPRNPEPRNTGEVYLVSYKISKNSQATACDPEEATFHASAGLMGNTMQEDKTRRQTRDDYCKRVKGLVNRENSASYTDILDAMPVAAKVLAGGASNGPKILVVFSDMIQQTTEYDFAKLRLTPDRIQRIIKELDQKHRLPNLSGVQVWVAGAGANRGDGPKPEKLQQIEDFWTAYFKATKANMPSDHYAPSLLNFEVPQK